MDNKEIINQLYSSRKLSSNVDYELFDEALEKLDGNIVIDDVYEICKVFYDSTNDDEVMFGIVHLIEQLRGEDYLDCIAKCTPNMNEAHEWAMTLNKRIINSQEYFDKYIAVINNLESHNKDNILNLLKDVKNDNPKKFSEKIDLILNCTK